LHNVIARAPARSVPTPYYASYGRVDFNTVRVSLDVRFGDSPLAASTDPRILIPSNGGPIEIVGYVTGVLRGDPQPIFDFSS